MTGAAKIDRCEACRRPQRYGPPHMRPEHVDGVGMTLLCADPVDCRRHWPTDHRQATP